MKAIASFDMDKTLFDHGTWQIPGSAMGALQRLREQYYIVIATGRDMDAKYSIEMKDLVKPDAIIHLNGTKISVGDQLIYEHSMDRELVRRLLQYAAEEPFSLGITVGDEDYYINPLIVESHDLLRFGKSGRNFQDPWKLLDMPVRTMAYIGNENGVRRMEKAFPELKFPMFSSMQGADIVERDASKAEGLKRLCHHLGVDIKDTVAFGDSMNDYEILQAAGIGVAMGNSIEELKRVADYVTTNITDDGIWNACVALRLFD